MGQHTWKGTLNPGCRKKWKLGAWSGYGWYKSGHRVQLDAYPRSEGARLKYYDFRCEMIDGLLQYSFYVENESQQYPVAYTARVWYQ